MIKHIVTNKTQLAVHSLPIIDDDLIATIINDLMDTARYYDKKKVGCAGLAANQIGYLHRIIVVNHGGYWLAMVNPIIEKVAGCKSSLVGEGCLSRPSVKKKMRRDKLILATWSDEAGEMHQEEIKGFTARVIQHEVDHLNGRYI